MISRAKLQSKRRRKALKRRVKRIVRAQLWDHARQIEARANKRGYRWTETIKS